jgi:hypothetical protein
VHPLHLFTAFPFLFVHLLGTAHDAWQVFDLPPGSTSADLGFVVGAGVGFAVDAGVGFAVGAGVGFAVTLIGDASPVLEDSFDSTLALVSSSGCWNAGSGAISMPVLLPLASKQEHHRSYSFSTLVPLGPGTRTFSNTPSHSASHSRHCSTVTGWPSSVGPKHPNVNGGGVLDVVVVHNRPVAVRCYAELATACVEHRKLGLFFRAVDRVHVLVLAVQQWLALRAGLPDLARVARFIDVVEADELLVEVVCGVSASLVQQADVLPVLPARQLNVALVGDHLLCGVGVNPAGDMA